MKLAFRAAALTLELIERRKVSFEKAFKEAVSRVNLTKDVSLAYEYARGSLLKSYLADYLLKSKGFGRLPLRRVCAFRVAFYLCAFRGLRAEEIGYWTGGLLSSKLLSLIRYYLEEGEGLLSQLDPLTKISVLYSHPHWLVKELAKNMGQKEVISLVKANERPVTWIRVNLLKAEEGRVVRKLEREGVALEKDRDLEGVYKVTSTAKPLSKLRAFKTGEAIIQDKGSVAVVCSLNPSPGETVLDACAAPGLKTIMLAQLMEGRGTIIALDISEGRLREMKFLLKRYGAGNVEILRADSRKLPLLSGNVDKALVDAPCSNSGAIRNDPALRLSLKDEGVASRWVKVQRDLISEVARNVKGEIVYSTCSLSAREGEEVMEWLGGQVTLKYLRPQVKGGMGFKGFQHREKYLRLFPHKDDCIAFFISKVCSE